MDEGKSKEVLETPQVHLFKHENIFGNSFKEEVTKQTPDLLRLNSVASLIDSPMQIMNTLTSNSSNASITSSFSNSFNNSAPKKNILFRTSSQSDIDLNRQDSVKAIDSVNTNYYSSQNSSTQSSILTPEVIDQNISTFLNKSNSNTTSNCNHNNTTNNFNLINEMTTNNTTNPNTEINNNTNKPSVAFNTNLKRKNLDNNNNHIQISDDFSLNLNEKLIKSNNNPNTNLIYQQNLNDSNETKPHLNSNGIHEQKTTNNTISSKKINAMNFEMLEMARGGVVTSHNNSNNKISSLINQNEIYCDNTMKINNYTPESLANKSRSSSSSNDDIVTSSDQNLGIKLKPKRSIMLNTDVRKQQIRNSNREAARRCRERRRNYIETLEANIRNLESKQKVLVNENSSLKTEVISLKKTIADQKNTNQETVKSNQNHSQNSSNNKNNQLSLVNNEIAPIGGVPLVVTLNLPNFDMVNSTSNSNQITVSNNDNNNNINNQQVLMKLLNGLIANNQNQNSNTTSSNNNNNNNKDITNESSSNNNNSIDNQSQPQAN